MYQMRRRAYFIVLAIALIAIVSIRHGVFRKDVQSISFYYPGDKIALSFAAIDSSSADTVVPSIYSSDLRYGMDTTISPCDDFYEYVNGTWRKEAKFPPKIPESKIFWNNFSDSPRRTHERLKTMIEEAGRSYATSSDPIIRLVGTFYHSCLVSDSLEISFASMSRGRKTAKTGKSLKDSTREEMCISRTGKYLDSPVGEMFAHKLDENRGFDRMRHMLASIKSEVGVLIDKHSLMSESDKHVAMNSLEKLYFRVGIPDKRSDYTGLKLSPTNYFDNKDAIANFNTVRSVNLIGGDVRELWKMSSFTANAFYSAAEHAIEVPPAMFIPPFFDPERDDALSYAASGLIIGHEIFHSLAAQLTSSDNPKMREEIDSFKAINSRLGTVDGWNTDGKRTYNEDVADLGGIKAAYRAWKKNFSKDKNQQDTLIEGLTPDQRFFVAYGRLWRGKWSQATAVNGGVHAALFARINGMVRQMPEFAKAFGCKEGDPMTLPKSMRSNLW